MKPKEKKDEHRLAYDQLHARSDLRFPLEDYGKFIELLGVKEGRKLADIACGKGFLLVEAEKKRVWALGVDFSLVGLGHAKKKTDGLYLVGGDVERLPIKDRCLDYVTSLGSLEHFINTELAICEMARVLKEDGKALVVVPNPYYLGVIWKVLRFGEGEKQEEQDIRHFESINDWKHLLEDNGLKILSTIKYNGFHHINWYFMRKDPQIMTLGERLGRSLMNILLKPIIPLNLSAYFIFLCKKEMV